MKALLIRLSELSDDKQTCGRFALLDDEGDIIYEAASLELPWMANMQNVSCIPCGTYSVTKAFSQRFGKDTFHVHSVKGRSHILIHPGNYNRDTEGCILLGKMFDDINADGLIDVAGSRFAIEELKKETDAFELTIIQI